MALAPGLLLDTHAWIWLRAGTLTAPPDALRQIRQAANEDRWFISSFSLSEIAHAYARKRLNLGQPLLPWFYNALEHPGPRALDITPEIAAATLHLPDSFHGDPGDRIIAATALVHNLTLCTHDKLLLSFAKHGLFSALRVDEKKERNARNHPRRPDPDVL